MRDAALRVRTEDYERGLGGKESSDMDVATHKTREGSLGGKVDRRGGQGRGV